MGNKFREAFEKGEFCVSAEVGPPKGTNTDQVIHEIELLKDKIHGLNVTDNQASVMRICSLAACEKIRLMDGCPILQVTCRDRNRIGLQSDLLGAAFLGIENVLCLTGDYVTLGDHIGAMPVFDLDSVHLLQAIRSMEQGKDLAGNEMDGNPKFFAGAVVAPDADPLEPQLIKFQKKVDAGAEFFQTQAVYDPVSFEKFMNWVEKKNIKVPVMAGIVMLKSVGMAKFMNANVAGVSVPQELIAEMKVKKAERAAKSIEISARLLRQFKPLCQGVHIMALGWEEHVPAILEQADITV